MEHVTTTVVAMLYTAASLQIAWTYFKHNSRAEYKTSDPFEHGIITLVLLITAILWPVLVPGWQINKAAVNNK